VTLRAGNRLARCTLAALSLVQIDHTLVDVIVVDSRTREPIQRPWLTLAIDVCSRCVAGFHLSLDAPSATSVALCVAHAALPKAGWLMARDVEATGVQGVIERLHLDNAKGVPLRGSQARLRPIWDRGRLSARSHAPLRRTHRAADRHDDGKVHLLPGTTFSNVRSKGDIDPSKTAAMTLDEVERWLAHAIVGVYHRDLHRGIGRHAARRLAARSCRRQRQPGRGTTTPVIDPRRFLIDFLPIERRLVRRQGVFLFSIAYWSDVLRTLIGERDKMIVRYDPATSVVSIC